MVVRMKQRLNLLLILCLCVATLSSAIANELEVKLMVVNGQQRDAYYSIINEFSYKNKIKVKVTALSQADYKAAEEELLKGSETADVLFGFAGNKLNTMIEQKLVANIDDLWGNNGFDAKFSSTRKAVFRDHYYALPVQYYQWGIYYNKEVFATHAIEVPTNWEQFLTACEQLKSNNIIPITLASKDLWPVMGWFDYVMLRTTELSTYRALLQGQLDWDHPSFDKAIKYLQMLFFKDYVINEHESLAFPEEQSYLLQRHAGMMLMGNFWLSKLRDDHKSKIGFFKFPAVDEHFKKQYEISPLDVLYINAGSKNHENSKKLLLAFSKPDNLFLLNKAVNTLSPNQNSPSPKDPFLLQGRELLEGADDVFFFFDREAKTSDLTKTMETIRNLITGKVDYLSATQALNRFFQVT